MRTPGEVAAALRDAASRVRPSLLLACEALASDVENLAKHLVGQENPEWAPLASVTVEVKTRLGYVGQVSPTDPLLRTGQMRDSIQSGAEPTPEGALFWVGSDSEVARDQELGTAKIPPRPFMSLAVFQSEWRVEAELDETYLTLLSS